MKTKSLGNFLFVICALALISIAYSCKSDDVITPVVGPDANTINGTVTFADTGFISTGGVYLISAFTTWLPSGPPAAYDTIKISRGTSGRWNTAYDYKLKGISSGAYAISVGFRKSTGGQSPIMGLYGCDTTHNMCVLTDTVKARVINNSGVAGINFPSWADTTKKLY